MKSVCVEQRGRIRNSIIFLHALKQDKNYTFTLVRILYSGKLIKAPNLVIYMREPHNESHRLKFNPTDLIQKTNALQILQTVKFIQLHPEPSGVFPGYFFTFHVYLGKQSVCLFRKNENYTVV